MGTGHKTLFVAPRTRVDQAMSRRPRSPVVIGGRTEGNDTRQRDAQSHVSRGHCAGLSTRCRMRHTLKGSGLAPRRSHPCWPGSAVGSPARSTGKRRRGTRAANSSGRLPEWRTRCGGMSETVVDLTGWSRYRGLRAPEELRWQL